MDPIRFARSPRVALLACTLALAACERPPMETSQIGYRGTGMEQVVNPRLAAQLASANLVPPALEPASADGPKAREVFKNVPALGHLSVGEFTRFMVAMTNWVAPQQGCLYCHTQNFAEEGLYTKTVSRRMIQMTQRINSGWKDHVKDTGVTCYTCHRGQPVPGEIWFSPETPTHANRLLGNDAQQNRPGSAVGLASLPYDPFGPYLASAGDAKPIRVIGQTALPTGNRASTKQTEFTYGLMMHMSDALGVNCTFCHNSRSFTTWDSSPPQRSTAWYGIRMVQEVNGQYMTPLTATFPRERLGPTGDVPKVNCATCHQGVNKPLNGARMLDAHPELASLAPSAAAPAVPAPPAASAAPPAQAATVLFGVGSAALTADAAGTLAPLVERLKSDTSATVAISGYHSASGDLATNQALAKNRALAVRDALAAAGLAPERLQLEKPLQAEANPSGEDSRSRRVEVTVR